MSVQSDLATASKCYCFEPKLAGALWIYLLAKKANLLTMTPTQLAAAAKCYCFDDDTQKKIVAYLLEEISAQGQTPTQLAAAAKCFCFDEQTQRNVVAYLLDVISGGSTPGGCPQDMQVAWTPTNLKLGEEIGYGVFGDMPGITTITFLQEISLSGFDIENVSSITTLSWPNLTGIDPNNVQGGASNSIVLKNNLALTLVDLPVLNFVPVSLGIAVQNNPVLSTINMPSLTTFGNGMTLRFSGNALSSSFVNDILHRLVLNAGYVSGDVEFGGGTNGAPSGQGVADKATLIGRGVTVNTN